MTVAAGAPFATSPPLIYVVDDDLEVSRVVAQTLREFGFETEAFARGQAMLDRLRAHPPDLFIVDLGLPDMDGIELVRRLGALDAGILILTARGHAVDRVMGLELGGDDYMVKPFEPRELIARVRSILRRRAGGAASPKPSHRYARFPGWTFDCASNVLRADDGSEHLLGTAEARVLRAFVDRPNQILAREQLIGTPDISPFDRSIDVRISRLRRKIEIDPHQPKVIKTVYGAGYLFAAAVHWIQPSTDAVDGACSDVG